ncbi:hypothetical protein ACGLHS_21645 [Variovorax sp. VaC1]|uniref:hypothetical protein n=1 Tax=Variovorax sp. VaC1 TaxID=3373132 RepID=UPI003747D46D
MLVFMFFTVAKTCLMCIIEAIDTKQDILMAWHPVQVKEALQMSETNPSKLAKEHGYAHFDAVLHRPRVAVQRSLVRPSRLAHRGQDEETGMFEECPKKVAAFTGQANEPGSATSEEKRTVKKSFVETAGRVRPAGGV